MKENRRDFVTMRHTTPYKCEKNSAGRVMNRPKSTRRETIHNYTFFVVVYKKAIQMAST